jgi:hypothetical protein
MQIDEIEKSRSVGIINANPMFDRNEVLGSVMDVAEAFERLAKAANVKTSFIIFPKQLLNIIRNWSSKNVIPTADPVKRIVEKLVRGKDDVKLIVLYGTVEDFNIVKASVGQKCKILYASDGDEVAPHDNGPIRVIPGHICKECWRGSWWRILPRAMLNTPPPPVTAVLPDGFIHEHDFLTEKGMLLHEEGKNEDAYATFERVLELNPDCLRGLYIMSMFLISGAKNVPQSSDRDAALKDAEEKLQRCIGIDPSFRAAYLAFSHLYEARGDAAQAASYKAKYEALSKADSSP